MRHTRRFLVTALALSGVGVLVGCGGGGSESSGGTASGRFVVREVTPADLYPTDAAAVQEFTVQATTPAGLVAGTVFRPGADSNRTLLPVLIDVVQQRVTYLRYDGADVNGPLTSGRVRALSPNGKAYGYFDQKNPTPTTPLVKFTYERATGVTLLGPSEASGPVEIVAGQRFDIASDSGQLVIVEQDNALPPRFVSSVARYESLSTTMRPILPALPGYSAIGQFINAGGLVAGRLVRFDSTEGAVLAFTWNDGVVTVLPGFADGKNTYPIALLDDGTVFGVAQDANDTPRFVTWRDGNIALLPPPPVAFTLAQPVANNRRGDVLVRLASAPNYLPGPPLGTVADGERWLWRSRSRTWVKLDATLTAGNEPLTPLSLLDDGRILCKSTFKLYTLTPQ